MSAVLSLRDLEMQGGLATLGGAPKDACIDTVKDRPNDTGGSEVIVLTAFRPAACDDAFAVQIWSNDVGQITAVNLLLGSP